MIRVLIAEDQQVVRRGLQVILDEAADIHVTGEASSGPEAVQLARSLRPDVVLMDLRMPGGDGLTATRELAGPDAADPLPVVVLTSFDADEYVFGALEAGASGFLLKDAATADILAAVRAAAAGDAMISPAVTRRVIAEFTRLHGPGPVRGQAAGPAAAGTANRVAAVPGLTPREADIVRALSEGLSNAEIGKRLHLDAGTVRNHLSKVMAKVGASTRTGVVVWAFRNKLVD